MDYNVSGDVVWPFEATCITSVNTDILTLIDQQIIILDNIVMNLNEGDGLNVFDSYYRT